MLAALEQLVPIMQPRAKSAVAENGSLVLDANDLLAACRFLKESPEYQLDYLADLTAVDYPPERIEVIYHLYSIAKKHGPLSVKVKLPRATPNVPSLVPIYRGAEFQEREAWDLFGVKFEGHPDLRRILMWEGFDGHPMRKDYVVEDQDAPIRHD
jgi:NADH/F420H2 dehydrogenase subunit C